MQGVFEDARWAENTSWNNADTLKGLSEASRSAAREYRSRDLTGVRDTVTSANLGKRRLWTPLTGESGFCAIALRLELIVESLS